MGVFVAHRLSSAERAIGRRNDSYPHDDGTIATPVDTPIQHLSLSVVIPTKNEERNIGWVLERIPPQVDEVVIVDGLSTDRTLEVARIVRPDVKIVHESRRGKGAAIRAGIAVASGFAVAMLDADCSMDPLELPRFVEPVAAGVDLVKGSRFLAGGGTADMTRLRQLGNWGLDLGTGRVLMIATLASSLVMVVFEGIGVGLLVPLMSLLLGGENATPMRPLQWMEAQFPDHSPGFYVAAFCVAIVVAIGLKNAVGYVSQLFSAGLKRRVVDRSLRDALFERLQRADLDTCSIAARRRAGQHLPRRDDPHQRCDRCRRGPRSSGRPSRCSTSPRCSTSRGR